MMGEVLRETLRQESSALPLELICVNNTLVKLIVSLDYVEGAARPFVVRAWDWIARDVGSGQGPCGA
jgi:hypothetical protein